MINISEERLLAEIALAGILAEKYKEAEDIAAWLLIQEEKYHESGKLIMVTSWHACKKYADIIDILSNESSILLLPFKALSEYHLGLHHNLKKTIKTLKNTENKELISFAEQFEEDFFMTNNTTGTVNTPNMAKRRHLLWKMLESCPVDNPKYHVLCDSLIHPIISELEKSSYHGYLDREFLLKILSHYDEYGLHQEFILSRLWQELPNILSGTILKEWISDELNSLIEINNQLILNQYNLRRPQ